MLPKDNSFPEGEPGEGRTWIGLERELGEQRRGYGLAAWATIHSREARVRHGAPASFGMNLVEPAINPILERRK
jgi:hypothetical protein